MDTWKGIDVSDNQGIIDWAQVAAAGCQFAILRSVRGSGKADYQFANNIAGCKKNGIPVSVYKYTYATTEQAAKTEAQQVAALLQSYKLQNTMVWWDVEDRKTLQPLGKDRLTACVMAAQAAVEAAGHRFGIYTGLYVYSEKWLYFDQFATKPFWVARYPTSSKKTLGYTPAERYKPNINRGLWGWQHSSNGCVQGINGAVDLDICYQNPIEQAQSETETGVIYTVSVADVWTRVQAETVQAQLAGIGIAGVVHKVQILE